MKTMTALYALAGLLSPLAFAVADAAAINIILLRGSESQVVKLDGKAELPEVVRGDVPHEVEPPPAEAAEAQPVQPRRRSIRRRSMRFYDPQTGRWVDNWIVGPGPVDDSKRIRRTGEGHVHGFER